MTTRTQHAQKGVVYKKCPKCGMQSLRRGQKSQSGKLRWVCTQFGPSAGNYCYSTTNPDKPYSGRNTRKKSTPNPKFRTKLKNENIIVTCAQNATPVHEGFMKALETLRDYLDARIAVIPVRYKNATSQWSESQENADYWEVDKKYLHNQRKKLNQNLVLAADVRTQPTATSPLTGFEGLTHGESCILGHTKVQVKAVPTPQAAYPKLMYTTGACTVPNYTDTKAGKLGEFHHSIGALLVQIEGKRFHIHQIFGRPSDGAFCWMDKIFYPDGTYEENVPSQAVIFGDLHYRFADPEVLQATFGKGGLVEQLNPEYQIFHDLMDGYSVNPHHIGNPLVAIAKQQSGHDDVEAEIRDTVEWLVRVTGDRKSRVVRSNHDDFLDRWVKFGNWKSDPVNAETYLETALAAVRSVKMTEQGTASINAFQYWVERLTQDADEDIRCLGLTESLTIGGIECSLHGDHGPNGVRGTIKNLSRLGVRIMSGHGHTPGWEEGHTRVGTTTPRSLEYTGPVGSWMNTHGSIDAHGQRHLHNIVEGQFAL